MNAESTVNNGSLTAEEMALLEAFRVKDFNKVGEVVGRKIADEETEATPEIPPMDEPTPSKYTLGDYLRDEKDDQWQADNKARNNPHLRIEMVALASDLDALLDDHAAHLAHLRGKNPTDTFITEELRDLITWQLAEFFSRSTIERDPDEPPILRGHQVTKNHAKTFFAVDSLALTDELVALDVEESRK